MIRKKAVRRYYRYCFNVLRLSLGGSKKKVRRLMRRLRKNYSETLADKGVSLLIKRGKTDSGDLVDVYEFIPWPNENSLKGQISFEQRKNIGK